MPQAATSEKGGKIDSGNAANWVRKINNLRTFSLGPHFGNRTKLLAQRATFSLLAAFWRSGRPHMAKYLCSPPCMTIMYLSS